MSDNDSSDNASTAPVSRRDLVRTIGAGSVAAVGFAGVGTADVRESLPVKDHPVVHENRDEKTIRRALADNEDMLETLHERGLLEASSASDVSVELEVSRENAYDTVIATSTESGLAPQLILTRTVDEKLLTVGIRLDEPSERYAVVGNNEPNVLDDVTTSGCDYCDCSCCTYDKCCAEYCCGPYSCGCCDEYWCCNCC